MGVTTETIKLNSKDNSRRGINSAKNNLRSLQRMSNGARASIAGVASVAALAALKRLATQTIDAADDIEKLGRRSGATARFISEMRHGLSQSAITMNDFNKSLIKINKSSQDAADGLTTPRRAFDKLGISVEDFQKLNTDQKFITLSEAISRVEDPAMRNQIAMDIMGRSGVQLLTVMENGAAGITAYREEAERLGLSLSQDQVDGAAAANDAIDKLTSSMSGAVSQAILPYTDEIARAADFTREYLPKAIEFLINVFRGMKLVVQTVILALVEHFLKLVELGEKIPKIGDKFKGMGDVLRGVSESVQSQISDNIDAINGQSDATDAVADAQKQAADIAARTYTPTIIDNTKALEAQNTTAEAAKTKTEELTEAKRRAAEQQRLNNIEMDRYNQATGKEFLRTQGQINQVLDEAALRAKNYAAGLESAKQVLKDRGLAEGSEAFRLGLEALGFQLDDVSDKTKNTTATMAELWRGSVGSVRDILQGFFTEGLTDFDNWYDSALDSLKRFLATFLAQWAASGILTLAQSFGSQDGLDWSGFAYSNAFGTGGGQSNGGGAGVAAAAAAGQLFGESTGQAVTTGVNAAGTASNFYGNLQGVEQGLEQGGTEGYLTAAISAYQAYENGAILWTTAANLFGSGGATAFTASAELAAGFSELTASISALPETVSVATTAIESSAVVAEGTAVSTGSGGAVSGALGAAAFWAAAAIAVDQIFFDGRAGDAGFKVHANRKDNLGQTGFTTLKTELYENPQIFLKDLFGARSFDEIVREDYLPELFGRRNAEGANGETGFAGGNMGVFGNDYGNSRAGISAVQLSDGGENGNGGFFTGAQASLDAFAQLAEAAGFATQSSAGFLEVMSDTLPVENLKELWTTYNDGLENAVTASERFATAYEANLIGPQNTLYQNLNLATGKNADAARDAILQIDKDFDMLVAGGMDASQALVGSFAQAFGLTAEQSAQFFAQSGLSIDHWVAQLSTASDEGLAELIEFSDDGTTAFEALNKAIQGTAENLTNSTAQATASAVTDFNGLRLSAVAEVSTIVTETAAANDAIVSEFIASRAAIEGSWQGLDLGQIKPIQIPTIEVPSTPATAPASAPQYLGAFNKGGRFIVPGAGNTDQPFTIDLTPGEEVEVRPNGQRNSAAKTSSEGGATEAELIDAVMSLVVEVSGYSREAVKLQNLMRKRANEG